MTTNELPSNPLIEKLIDLADNFNNMVQADATNAYVAVADLLDRIEYDTEGEQGPDYDSFLDNVEELVKNHFETDDYDVLIPCLEQLQDDMDDLEENCNE